MRDSNGMPTGPYRKEEGNKTYVLFFDSGEIIELTPKNMKIILADDPELLKQQKIYQTRKNVTTYGSITNCILCIISR